MKLLGIILLLALASFAFADSVPNYFPIQGRLMNASNSTLQGTNTIVFSIYNVSSGGTALYTSTQSITTSSDGVYAAMLTAMNLSFDMPYYLGVKVGSNAEMAPRTNLSTAPFAYRANISDWLNPNSTVFNQLGALQTSNASIYALNTVLNGSKADTGTCAGGQVLQGLNAHSLICVSSGGGTITTVQSLDNYITVVNGSIVNITANLSSFDTRYAAINEPLWAGNFSNFSSQITRLISSNGSIYVSIASMNVTVNDLVTSNTSATARITRLESSNGSIYTSLASLNVTINDLVTSNGTTLGRVSRLESSNGSIYVSISALNTSTDGRLTRLENSNTTIYIALQILNNTLNATKGVAGDCGLGFVMQASNNNSAPTCVAAGGAGGEPLWSANFSNISDQITRLIAANVSLGTNLSGNWSYVIALNNNDTNTRNNLSTNWTYIIALNNNATNVINNLSTNWTYIIALNNNDTNARNVLSTNWTYSILLNTNATNIFNNLSNNWTYIQGLGSATDVANNLSANWTYSKSLNANNTNTQNNLSTNWTYIVALNTNATNIGNNLSTNWTYSILLNNNNTNTQNNLSTNWTYLVKEDLNATLMGNNLTNNYTLLTQVMTKVSYINITNQSGIVPVGGFSMLGNYLIFNSTSTATQTCDAGHRGLWGINESTQGDCMVGCFRNSTGSFVIGYSFCTG